MDSRNNAVQQKLRRLKEDLFAMERVLVAYSGGVDSTFLAKVAFDLLGENALAVTAVSESFPKGELEPAREVARSIGIAHIEVPTDETRNPAYLANNPDRCFHCKMEIYRALKCIANEGCFLEIVIGYIADDTGDYRPGMAAGAEYNIRTPLMDAGFTKEEVRLLSRQMGLPTWDKPSLACLASRLPYGTPIRIEALRQVDAAESFLREMGFRQVRVRHHDTIARIEVLAEDVPRFGDAGLRARVTARLKELGYAYVTIDLQGFRTGSLNETLPDRKS